MRLSNALRPHEQQSDWRCTGEFLDKLFGREVGKLYRFRRELFIEIEAAQFTVRVAGRNAGVRNEPVDTRLPEAVPALHTGRPVLDQIDPTRTVTFRTT